MKAGGHTADLKQLQEEKVKDWFKFLMGGTEKII